MSRTPPAAWLAFIPGLMAAAAAAQPTSTPPKPLAYQSALEGYQSFSDEKAVPWKDANDTVGRIGGWREYARESRPSQPQGTQAPPAAAPAANPHAGHGKKN